MKNNYIISAFDVYSNKAKCICKSNEFEAFANGIMIIEIICVHCERTYKRLDSINFTLIGHEGKNRTSN